MREKRLIAVLLIVISVSFGACAGNDAGKSSVVNVANTAPNENSSTVNNQSGGQVTVISGADKGVVKVRSTGFR